MKNLYEKNKKIAIFFVAAISFMATSGIVFAAGTAHVTWTAPTTDAGGGALTGLAGYKVYYKIGSDLTCSSNLPPSDADGSVDVGNVTSYYNDSLTLGSAYYFAVTAYDNASTPNESGCATLAGGATNSKFATYKADFVKNCVVGMADYVDFKNHYGLTDSTSLATYDIAGLTDGTRDGAISMRDYIALKNEYGQPTISSCPF